MASLLVPPPPPTPPLHHHHYHHVPVALTRCDDSIWYRSRCFLPVSVVSYQLSFFLTPGPFLIACTPYLALRDLRPDWPSPPRRTVQANLWETRPQAMTVGSCRALHLEGPQWD